jgi:hypothetical protein
MLKPLIEHIQKAKPYIPAGAVLLWGCFVCTEIGFTRERSGSIAEFPILREEILQDRRMQFISLSLSEDHANVLIIDTSFASFTDCSVCFLCVLLCVLIACAIRTFFCTVCGMGVGSSKTG